MKKTTLYVFILGFIFLIPSTLTAELFVEGNVFLNQNYADKKTVIEVDAVFNFPPGYYQTNQPEYFNFSLSGISNVDTSIMYPNTDKFRGETRIKAEFFLNKAIEYPYSTELILNYQLCDESGTCFFPKNEGFTVEFKNKNDALLGTNFSLAVPAYPQFSPGASEFPSDSTANEYSPMTSSANYQTLSSSSVYSILIIIGLAFIGGILLNIMPCVLPVLSLKAMHLVSLSNKGQNARIREGTFYSLGIISSLLVLGILAATLKALGEISGWGFQFQNPFFTVGLSFLVYMFALSMFDTYLINLPGLNFAEKSSHKSGIVGTYLSGVFAVLLATPCTAPFMGSALGLAFTLGPFMIIAAFTAIGAGLALPFFLLSIFPALLRFVPKPGNWMNVFKQFLGFLLFATLGWLLNTAYYQIGWNSVLQLFFIFLITGFLLWYFGNLQKSGMHMLMRKILLILIFAVVIAGIWVSGSTDNEQELGLKKGWKTFSPEVLELERMNGNPVFVAFSAQWCLTCKTNETTVLNTKDIQTFFKTKNVTLLYGDYTNNDPVIAEWIMRFGRSGVPVYAYYGAEESEPVILPEILSKAIIRDTIK